MAPDSGRSRNVRPSASTAPSQVPLRLSGLDMARAVAILGMVCIHTRTKLGLYGETTNAIDTWLNRLEGKPAALFFVLAGMSLGHWARARPLRESYAIGTRKAAALFLLGLAHLHYWNWDVLHIHAAFSVLGLALIRAPRYCSVAVACATLLATLWIRQRVDAYAICDPWTPPGMWACLVYSGLYPITPWFWFFVVGLIAREFIVLAPRHCTLIVLVGVMVGLGVETLAYWIRQLARHHSEIAEYAVGFMTWPRPARWGFLVSGTAWSLAIVAGCSLAAMRGAGSIQLRVWATIGRQSLSLYLAHSMLLTIVGDHRWLEDAGPSGGLAISGGLFAILAGAAWWWSTRSSRGPIEELLHIASRPPPAR